MKRILSVLFSVLFFAAISFAVVGCKKAEEQKPAEVKEAPAPAPAAPAAPAPAPEAAKAPEAAPAPAPAPEKAPAPAPAK